MSSIKYRPEIDGLRTIAVIPVVLFHLGFEWIKGGYFGVDVFFVISGFLITSIILKEGRNKTFSYRNFWSRRIRRILPALLVMIISVLIFSFAYIFRHTAISYGSDAFSAIFSYANVEMLLKFGDYWGGGAETSPFLHCWSLAVEEQFYILYPGLIVLLLANKTNPIKILVPLIILSFAFFIGCSIYSPQLGFYLLPARAWELGAGGLLAIYSANPTALSANKYRSWLSCIGLIMIMISYFVITGSEGIGFSGLLPVMGACLIILFSSPDDIVGKVLSNGVIVWIGKISYSLYLWHWPVIVVFKEFQKGLNIGTSESLIIIVTLTFTLSVLSYEFVEKPTRKLKPIYPLVITLLVISVFISSMFKFGFAKKQYLSSFEEVKFYGLYYDIAPYIKPVSDDIKFQREGIFAPPREAKFKRSYMYDGIFTNTFNRTPQVVVMGDSHSAMWGKLIDEIAQESNLPANFFSMVGNNPLFKIPIEVTKGRKGKGFSDSEFKIYSKNLLDKIAVWKPKVLIIACKWTIRRDEDLKNLSSIIDFAEQNNTATLLINQPPQVDLLGENNSAQYFSFLGYKPNGKEQFIGVQSDGEVRKSNALLYKLSLKHKRCTVINIHDSFIKDSKARIIQGKSVLYYDDDHLSYQGTQLVKNKVKDAINNAVLSANIN